MARFEVKATTAGQVTVSGSILSYEEKLAVSERLRRLLGCTSVVNQLEVTSVVRDGKPYRLVSVDGKLAVSAESKPGQCRSLSCQSTESHRAASETGSAPSFDQRKPTNTVIYLPTQPGPAATSSSGTA